jgi:hypothetical protein
VKAAILLGRGIEGCGVTRYALEEQKWYHNNGMECDIYASSDKKWPRRDSQDNSIIEFSNDEIKGLSKRLNEEYDIIYYQSLPAKKGHSDEYKNLFFEHLVCNITRPIKVSHQNDHKVQSLVRNHNIWETMAQMDGCFTHSLTSPFAEKMAEHNPSVPMLKMGLGFDFDSLLQYWKPIGEQKRRVSYFGRFAGFKDPQRIITMQPLLKEKGIYSEMRGIERSIGSLDLFYSDLNDRENSYRQNILEIKKDTDTTPDLEKVFIYGPYNRLEGIEELSYSMFGADFYNLHESSYGDNLEFAMCEIIATGSIALFDKHWSDNCTHINGTPFKDIDNFAIYCDKNDLESTVEQMNELANDNHKRIKHRNSAFEIARQHCDNSIVYKDMHEKALSVKTLKTSQSQKKTFALF